MPVYDVHKIKYRFLHLRDNFVRYCGHYENNKIARGKRAGAN